MRVYSLSYILVTGHFFSLGEGGWRILLCRNKIYLIPLIPLSPPPRSGSSDPDPSLVVSW